MSIWPSTTQLMAGTASTFSCVKISHKESIAGIRSGDLIAVEALSNPAPSSGGSSIQGVEVRKPDVATRAFVFGASDQTTDYPFSMAKQHS